MCPQRIRRVAAADRRVAAADRRLLENFQGYSSSSSRQQRLEMATNSRGDKGKAPMVEQEDIGTEEGELLDVHPPLPEPTGRSESKRKRKKHAREEDRS
ncbi:hypothetical protein R1sor_018409 [Riccia sorocarpa]|uniref:Uncharacterized protein n=1 Tax=Riccia sorocarpa TaxID=122646 RepID=A0ABD3ICB7_9MARC